MKVSVIIPTWNRSGYLARALESVFAQSVSPHEVIVVDDGSTDDTREIIKQQFSNVSYLYQENRGVSSARNTGIRAAGGDWIALLDSDDCWLPNKLQRQCEEIHHSDTYQLCHTNGGEGFPNGIKHRQNLGHGRGEADIAAPRAPGLALDGDRRRHPLEDLGDGLLGPFEGAQRHFNRARRGRLPHCPGRIGSLGERGAGNRLFGGVGGFFIVTGAHRPTISARIGRGLMF